MLMQRKSLDCVNLVFHDPNSSPDRMLRQVVNCSEICVEPYSTMSLNLHTIHSITKSVSNIKLELASLPHTEETAIQHSYLIFYRIDFDRKMNCLLSFEDGNALMSITTTDPVVPEALINLIFCHSTTDCRHNCGCRKTRITCIAACYYCYRNLSNSPPHDQEDVLIQI